MTIARLEDGQVVEFKDLMLEEVPEHKRAMWRTVVDTPPSYDSRVEVLNEVGWAEPTETTISKIYEILPVGELARIAAIKAEAQRRIIALMGAADMTQCIIKQLNAQMRAAKLLDKKASGHSLTEEELAEEQALNTIAVAIENIRQRSNEIEVLQPLPKDWDSNARWS